MKFQTSTRAASTVTADCLVAGVFDNGDLDACGRDLDSAGGGWLTKAVRSGDAATESGKVSLLTPPAGIKAKRVAVVGLGKADKFDARRWRKAVAKAAAALTGRKLKRIAVGLSLEAPAEPYYLGRWAYEIVAAAVYQFDTMKSMPSSTQTEIDAVMALFADQRAANLAKIGGRHGVAIAEGVSIARDLGNLPPNVCTPTYLGRFAQSQSRQSTKLTTQVLNEAALKKHGMGAFLAVTAGAKEPARMIVMQYRGAARGRPIVLVGKGITFDAGGISLKPPQAMDEMKYDMCGAASVIATIVVAAKLDLPINVTAVVPTCENLPSGTATRPGDIVKTMSGQTVEILNTDAEGRLILCDALTYSRRFKPDTIIDVATLTGACVIALGHHLTAVMSTEDELRSALVAAGERAEDRAWPMPASEEYGEALKSNFADFANVGGREGGASAAACFLAKFTDDLNWAHLDIAGTAWKGGSQKGATGRPVPMLAEYLLERADALPG